MAAEKDTGTHGEKPEGTHGEKNERAGRPFP
jgi:hypothetical protein